MSAKVRPALPRQIPPTRITEQYAGALVKILARVRAAWAPVIRAVPDIADAAAAERGDAARSDSSASKKAQALIKQAVEIGRRAVSTHELEQIARRFARQTSEHQREQLARQARAAVGVDPVFRDKGMTARVEHFVQENVALVQRIPERLHGDLAAIVLRAVSGGMRAADPNERRHTLATEIEARFGVAERHARLIARDQVLKFHGKLNKARQKDIGITRFVWRDSGDERVRGMPDGKYADAKPSHHALDGLEFEWDNPPTPPGAEGPLLPGEDYECRCTGEPVWDDDENEDSD